MTQDIVLSDKPPITSTIRSLPPQLLDSLLTELSTLASVYHKPPEAFLGQGRFGAEAMQRAAIEYVSLRTTDLTCANETAGNNKKRQEKIRLLLLPQRQPSVVKHRRQQTWRTFWILTLMAQRRLRRKDRLVWKDLRAHPSVWRLPQPRPSHSQTWMICWVFSETEAAAEELVHPAHRRTTTTS
jgi:hypothetical protein